MLWASLDLEHRLDLKYIVFYYWLSDGFVVNLYAFVLTSYLFISISGALALGVWQTDEANPSRSVLSKATLKLFCLEMSVFKGKRRKKHYCLTSDLRSY